ncbi:MAG: TetR/AcrR family transcriptional regulator C-terminal domain-containing protein [Actinomycetales bacterium]
MDQPQHAPEREGRSASKRRAIVEAATEAFLRSGYRGTSMDEIAAAAGVSKQTVYKHFADKERLFAEIVRARVDEASTPVSEGVRGLRDSGSLEADLRELARRQLDLVMQPRILQLRRLVISEAARFPELGRTFYEQGVERAVAALASTFEALAARGLLVVPDSKVAATHFNWLIMSGPMNRAMLLGLDVAPPAKELDRWADEGVRTFLAAYGAR